jgi:hypothetical protein
LTHTVCYNLLNEQEEEDSMLRKRNITPYAIIMVLTALLISPVNAIAQTKNNKLTSKEQGEQKLIPQKIQTKKNVKPQVGLSSSVELTNKIAILEVELLQTKTALLAEQQNGDKMYKEIKALTTTIKDLQDIVNENKTKLVSLKDVREKYNDVITCYRKGLSAWDKQLHTKKLTGQDRLTISTELRSVIRKCPSI